MNGACTSGVPDDGQQDHAYKLLRYLSGLGQPVDRPDEEFCGDGYQLH
jgi:hypothetical protein